MKNLYAVFEGGGVKGIAHVGAFARAQFEQNVLFKGFAGSSAGAIVASLAAAGYDALDPGQNLDDLWQILLDEDLANWPGEMVQTMRQIDYLKFLEGHDEVSLAEIKNSYKELTKIAALYNYQSSFNWLTMPKKRALFRAWWNSGTFEKIVKRVINNYGLYGTSPFLNWMHEQLVNRGIADNQRRVTFLSLMQRKQTYLTVIATDLIHRTALQYNFRLTGTTDIAQAVQASMSIPIFFQPFSYGNGFLVDGGLVSNFPAWVFSDELDNDPDAYVLGFQLAQGDRTNYAIETFEQFAGDLFQTTLGGSAFMQTHGIDRIVQIPIQTNPKISAVKFDLTPEEQFDLFKSGWDTADEVLSKPDIRQKINLDP